MRTYDAAALAQLAAQANPCTVVVRIGKIYDPEGVIAGGIAHNLELMNSQVFPLTDSIRFAFPHNLETGDSFVYRWGATPPIPVFPYYVVTSPQVGNPVTLYAIRLNAYEVQWATSYANALAGTAINITYGGAGVGNQPCDPTTGAAVSRVGTASGGVFTLAAAEGSPWVSKNWYAKLFQVLNADSTHQALVGTWHSIVSNTATTFTGPDTITGATEVLICDMGDSGVGRMEFGAFSTLPGNTEVGYFSNGPVTGAPGNVYRWLSGTMPGLQAQYNEQKASLSMGGIQFDIDDKDGQFTKLVYSILGPISATKAWYKREVYLYLLPTRAWSSALLLGRFLLKEPPKSQGLFYKFYTNDLTKLLSGEIDHPEQKFKLRGVLRELLKGSAKGSGVTTKHVFDFTTAAVPIHKDGSRSTGLETLVLLAAQRLFLVCVEGTAPVGTIFRITALTSSGSDGANSWVVETVTCASAMSGDRKLMGPSGTDVTLKVTKGYIGVLVGSGDGANPVKDVMGFDYTGLARIADPVVDAGTLLDTDQKFLNSSFETWSGGDPATPWVASAVATGVATGTWAKNEVLAYVYGGVTSVQLTLPAYLGATQNSYVELAQNITGTSAQDIKQRKLVVGAHVLCGDAFFDPYYPSLCVLGCQAQLVVEYFTNSTCTGTPAVSYTSPWQDTLGAQQVFGVDQLTGVVPEWSAWAQEDGVNALIPADALSLTVRLRFRNRPQDATGDLGTQQPTLTKVFVDAAACLVYPAGLQYEDTYVTMNREVFDVDAIYADADTGKAWMSVVGRGRLGTLPCRHKRDAQGNLIRVVGGYDYTGGLTQVSGEGHPKAHPLNVLLALLTSTATTHSYYVPWLPVGRDAPTGRVPWRGNNVWYDVNTSRYYGWDIGYGWGLGVPLDYIDWRGICALRDTAAFRGQLCEFRLKEGIANFKDWSEEEIMRPFGYRWVLGLDGKLSVAPVVGDASSYSPVDTIEERDMEGLPDVEYASDVLNQITWQFDSDLSETTDNAQNSKYISLHTYNEASFWSIPAGQSSLERCGGKPEEAQWKALGLRGCVSSKFANGYDLGGDQVARRVSHDMLLRWRDQLPSLKMDVGLKYMPIDAGDIVYVQHSKLWDLNTGARWPATTPKKAQVTSVKHDYSKKKVTLDAVLLDSIPNPMTYFSALGAEMPTPRYDRSGANGYCDVFIAHYDGDSAYEDMKNLDIRDYPFDISNLFFVCQSYGRVYSNLSDFLASTTGATADIVHRKWHRVPSFSGYRHTVIRVYNALQNAFVKVGEFNGPYAFFNWVSDADTKGSGGQFDGDDVPGPVIRLSYASTHYDPATGLYEDGYALGKYVEIDLSGKSFKGTDLQTRYEEQTRERRMSGRLYARMRGPGENRP